MPLGLKIEVTEEDFEKKTGKEQNLILYKMLKYIDENGTQYERKKMKRLHVVAASSGAFFGALAGLLKGVVAK